MTADITTSSQVASNVTALSAGSVVGGIVFVLLAVAIVLLVVVLVRQSKQNKTYNNDVTYPNPVYDGKWHQGIFTIGSSL